MATTTNSSENPDVASREGPANAGYPGEQLEIEEGDQTDEGINYPTGPKLWLTMTSLFIACFLQGLV